MTTYVAGSNPQTKKALKELVASGKELGAYTMSPFGENIVENGKVAISGPKYPQPHKWYATCQIVNGKIVSVK